MSRGWRPGWPCDPYAVLSVLRRGAGDPSFHRDTDGTVWRAAYTPAGPATLRVVPRPREAVVNLQAWGAGAEWMLEQAPELLGGQDDVTGFAPTDPRVRRAWAQNMHWRVARTGLVFEALVGAVLEQKVSGHEAWLGWRRLLYRHGIPAPGPAGEDRDGRTGMRCLPDAATVARIPSWEWLRCHVDGRRSATVVRAARRAAALERTVGRAFAEVDSALRSIPGVGVWTSAEVRQRAHGDPDAVSFGDYNVARHVGWALRGRELDDEGLAVLLEPDRPHRYRIQHIVMTRMPGRPRRGPRMAPRRHLPT